MEAMAWLVLAAVHLMPALAFVLPRLLTKLYGLMPENPLHLLMQHRAALFLVIFVICVWSAFDPAPRRLAVVSVGISMLSFLILYGKNGAPVSLRQIAIADVIGLPALTYVAWNVYAAN